MSKEFPNRIHGDGRLIINGSFYAPIDEAETSQYLAVLENVLEKTGIDLDVDPQSENLPGALLALKQRLMIAFSNGCPWPENGIVKHLNEQEIKPATLDELAVLVRKGAEFDGKHSFLFQSLLRNASDPLKEELKSYHPWQRLSGQEDDHLPREITDPDGKGAYGLANSDPYFEVLIPLSEFIEEGDGFEDSQARYLAVNDFFEQAASEAESVAELIGQAKEFLTEKA